MSATATLPLWLVVTLTVAPAVIAATAAVMSAWLAGARKSAKQLDQWRRREETMRLLRWAADKVGSENGGDTDRLLGLSVLEGLDKSKPAMLQTEDQGILDAVLNTALQSALEAVEAHPGDEVEEADPDGG